MGKVNSSNEISSPHAAVATLQTGIAELGGMDLQEVADEELEETLVGIDRAIARLEAQRARYLRVFDERRAYLDKASTPVAWLRFVCRMTAPAAAARLAVARRLPQLPNAQKAFEDGDIGYQHAATITRVLDDVGVTAAKEHEELLVEGAKRFDPGYVRAIGRHLREYVDTDAALDDENALYEGRWLHVSPTLDGVVHIDGRLDPEGGAIVMTALDSLMTPRSNDNRLAWQRRADALTDLCRRQLDGGDLPERGGQRPHVSLTVSIDKLQGDRRAPLGELEWIGSISTETARRLTCDALVTTVVVDAEGKPLVIAPEARVVPTRLRRALVIRDGGCIGCGAPPSWCDAHHIRHLANGGDTKLSNLGLLRLSHECLTFGGARGPRPRFGSQPRVHHSASGLRPPELEQVVGSADEPPFALHR